MSKYKFLKIQRHDIPGEPHWVVCVDSLELFLNYAEKLAERNVQNYILAKQCNNIEHCHFGALGGLGALQYAFAMELSKDENQEGRYDMVDDLKIISKTFDTPYRKVFLKCGSIYCNPVGGFYPSDAVPHTILETVETDTFKFPEILNDENSYNLKPRIIQWPNGTHYYAKIGMEDVVDERGNQKWDTREAAENAAKAYLAKKKQQAGRNKMIKIDNPSGAQSTGMIHQIDKLVQLQGKLHRLKSKYNEGSDMRAMLEDDLATLKKLIFGIGSSGLGISVLTADEMKTANLINSKWNE